MGSAKAQVQDSDSQKHLLRPEFVSFVWGHVFPRISSPFCICSFLGSLCFANICVYIYIYTHIFAGVLIPA